jgi:hypothetical protein
MRIGIVMDGDAESQAFKRVTRRLGIQGVTFIDPVYADLQPKAAAGQIARAAVATIETLVEMRGAERVIVIIDREDNAKCPGSLRDDLEDRFKSLGRDEVLVVIKNRQFENWLIADPQALHRASSQQFRKPSPQFIKAVRPNRADSVVDPVGLLDALCREQPFHKRRDAAAVCDALDVPTVAANSRSFRRFLRAVDHHDYLTQSAKP